MKKILIISQGYWPEVFPINTIVNQLSKSKFKIDVLTGYPNYPKGLFYRGFNPYKVSINKLFKHRIVRVPIIPRGVKSKIGIILNYLSFIISSITFGSFYLRKEKYDIILVYATSPIFQSYIGIYFKFLKKAKLITWVQDLWPNVLKDTGVIKNFFLLNVIKLFVRNIYNANDLLLAQSKSFKKDINKISKTKVSILHNPGYSEKKKNHKVKFKKKINILYAGNIGNAQPWENLLKFLKMKKLDNFKFTICGEGQKYSFIKNYIKENRIKNISLYGYLKNKKLENQYSKSNYLLVMLKSGTDLSKTIPSKFQTYLFHGKPILALNDGEVYKFVKDFNLGFASKPNNLIEYENVFKAMQKIKKNQYHKISKNIRSFYLKNFSQKVINKKLINEINKI